MSDEELMSIAFSDKRTVQDILRYIFEIGEQKGRTDAIQEIKDKMKQYVNYENIDLFVKSLKELEGK